MPTNPQIEQLRTAGFTPTEIGAWGAKKREELTAAGFGEREIDAWFGDADHAKANASLAQTIADRFAAQGADAETAKAAGFMGQYGFEHAIQVGQEAVKPRQVPSVGPYSIPNLEAVLNLATGLGAGFPAYMVGGVSGLARRALGSDEDPKEIAAKYAEAVTYQPRTEQGQATAETLATPFTLLTEGAEKAGKFVASKLDSPVAGALTEATIQTLPLPLLASLGRRMAGRKPAPTAFPDAAEQIAPDPVTAAKVDEKLRTVYEKTGVDPEAVAAAAEKDVTVSQKLMAEPLPERPQVQVAVSAERPMGDLFKAWDEQDGSSNRPWVNERDILDKLDELDDGVAPKEVLDAADAFRDAIEEDFQMAGRGEVDAPAEAFIAAVRIAADAEAKSAPESAAPAFESRARAALGIEEPPAAPPKEPPKPPGPPDEPSTPLGDAQEKVLSKVVFGEEQQKWPTLGELRTRYIDKLNPIRKVQETNPKEGVGPYDLERLTAGVFGKVAEFVKYNTRSFSDYSVNGKSYEQVLKPVENDLKGFVAYMVSRRAVELAGRGIETGIDLEAAKKVVADGGKYAPVFEERLAYRARLLDYLQESGILGKDARAAMEALNRDYVPFYRYFEGNERPSGANGPRNPIKAIKGSERDIIDPLTSDLKDTALFIALAEKNAARQALVKLGPEVAQKVKPKVRPIEVDEAEIQSFLADQGVEAIDPSKLTIFRAMRSNIGADEILVFDEGKPSVYKVDPGVAEAFNGIDQTSAGFLSNMLQKPAEWLRAGVTIDPAFFPRNLIRDAVTSFAYAGSHPIKTIKGAIGIATKDEAFHKWLMGGGANATMVAMDSRYLQRHLQDLEAGAGLMSRGWNIVKSPIEALRIASEFAENSTRLGAVHDGLMVAKDKAAVQALTMISRNATTDFAVHGASPTFQKYSRMTAFMNPGIQGIDRFYQAMADPKQRLGVIAKSLGAVTVPSLLLWWRNQDDGRWADIPGWQKDLSWIVMEGRVSKQEWAAMTPEEQEQFNSKHTIYRLPKPYDLGVIFGSIPERVAEKWFTDNPEALKDIDKTMQQAFGVNAVPTFLAPMVDQWSGRSGFTGHPLFSAAAEKQLPEYQYSTHTTELAKAIGSIMGAFPGMKDLSLSPDEGIGVKSSAAGVARALTSPILVENYVHAWTGGIGTHILKLTDLGLRKTGMLPDPPKAADTLADVPVVQAFIVRYPSSNAEVITRFYDEFTKHEKVAASIEAQLKEGNVGVLEKELAFDPIALMRMTAIKTALTEHSQIIRNIDKNADMTPADKRQLIDTTYFRMIELARFGVEFFRESEKKARTQ